MVAVVVCRRNLQRRPRSGSSLDSRRRRCSTWGVRMHNRTEEDSTATGESSRHDFPAWMDGPDYDAVELIREISAHEAITRKVLEPQVLTMPVASFPLSVDPKPAASTGRFRTLRLLVTASVVVGLAAVTIGLWTHNSRRPRANTRASVAVTPTPASPRGSNDLTRSRPSVTPLPEVAPLVETIHLEIDIEPIGATLTLDQHAVVGYRLQTDVPKDRRIHVVAASAPGFLPFEQIISFSRDIHLIIKLHRSLPVFRGKVKSPPAQVEPKPTSELKRQIQPSQIEEPGMKMERPSIRRPSNQLDERDPYSP